MYSKGASKHLSVSPNEAHAQDEKLLGGVDNLNASERAISDPALVFYSIAHKHPTERQTGRAQHLEIQAYKQLQFSLLSSPCVRP